MNKTQLMNELMAFNVSRIKSIADNMFTAVMTLIVLSLTVPIVAGPLKASNHSVLLSNNLADLIPNILIHAITFFILGGLWVTHNNMLNDIKYADNHFLWMNICFFFVIGFIPFSIFLMPTYSYQPLTLVIFGINMAIASALITMMWIYASKHQYLIENNINPQFIENIKNKRIVLMIIYLLAAIFAFYDVKISFFLFIIAPIINIMETYDYYNIELKHGTN